MNNVFKESESKMNKTMDVLDSEYKSIRAGRANPAVLDKVLVDYYGTPTPIHQMAAVSVVEARTIVIQPWDLSTLNDIEKAIQVSDIGINPQNDGKVLRITFPPLTEDSRKKIAKDVSRICEDAKVAVRAIRRDCIDKLKKMKKDAEITEDDLKSGEKKIQDITDKFCKIADDMAATKEREVMSI